MFQAIGAGHLARLSADSRCNEVMAKAFQETSGNVSRNFRSVSPIRGKRFERGMLSLQSQ